MHGSLPSGHPAFDALRRIRETSDFESTVTNPRPLQDVEVVDKGGFSALNAASLYFGKEGPKIQPQLLVRSDLLRT